jgi:hypothetical protein
MPRRLLAPALVLLATCRTAPDRQGEVAAAADLVFRNGAVYTVDAARSWASAVGVRHGRIVYQLAIALDRAGFQIHVHAIDDRAIRMALDALARARAANGPRDLRHGITHLELIDPEDIPRFRALGVVANFEPLWANGDEYSRSSPSRFWGRHARAGSTRLPTSCGPVQSSPAAATGRPRHSTRSKESRSASLTATREIRSPRRGIRPSGSTCRP